MRNGLCLCRLLAASGLPVIRALSELCGGRLVTVATLQAQVEQVNAQWPMFVPFARRVGSPPLFRLGLTPVFQDHNLGVAFEPYVSRSFNGCEIGSH